MNYLKRYYILYLMCLPAMVFYIIFKYIPMYGVVIAFKDYNIFEGMTASEWVGLKVFKEVFSQPFFWQAIKNTLILNLLTLLVSFPLTILLSLMLNEVRAPKFKKFAQSLLYLPYFISWVVVAGLVTNLFSLNTGSVNMLLSKLGIGPVSFLIEEKWWIFTYIVSQVWKNLGWGTIIYLAALAGVDETLYEAAYMDGATKLQRIWHITLPSIKNTIVVMFILQISKMMAIGLDAPLLLQNDKVINVAEVISTYVYKVGLVRVEYSLATAIGLFQAIVNITLLFIANTLTKAVGEKGVF